MEKKIIAFELKDVCKYYGSGDYLVKASDHVSLQVEKGSYLAIVGASGSGKSTLLHMMGGIESYDRGSIHIIGQDIGKMKEGELAEFRRINIGFVFQQFLLLPSLNVYNNIILPTLIVKDKVEEEYLKKIVAELQIEDLMDRFPSQLSGGQQQRVSIARALINKADIILADEPTGNLDSTSALNVIQLLEKLCFDLRKTLIVVTHDLGFASRAETVIEIIDGVVFIKAML